MPYKRKNQTIVTINGKTFLFHHHFVEHDNKLYLFDR